MLNFQKATRKSTLSTVRILWKAGTKNTVSSKLEVWMQTVWHSLIYRFRYTHILIMICHLLLTKTTPKFTNCGEQMSKNFLCANCSFAVLLLSEVVSDNMDVWKAEQCDRRLKTKRHRNTTLVRNRNPWKAQCLEKYITANSAREPTCGGWYMPGKTMILLMGGHSLYLQTRTWIASGNLCRVHSTS